MRTRAKAKGEPIDGPMDAEAFWAFSLQFYGREHVPSMCVAMQDGHGADVEMVLFALWCATRGRRL